MQTASPTVSETTIDSLLSLPSSVSWSVDLSHTENASDNVIAIVESESDDSHSNRDSSSEASSVADRDQNEQIDNNALILPSRVACKEAVSDSTDIIPPLANIVAEYAVEEWSFARTSADSDLLFSDFNQTVSLRSDQPYSYRSIRSALPLPPSRSLHRVVFEFHPKPIEVGSGDTAYLHQPEIDIIVGLAPVHIQPNTGLGWEHGFGYGSYGYVHSAGFKKKEYGENWSEESSDVTILMEINTAECSAAFWLNGRFQGTVLSDNATFKQQLKSPMFPCVTLSDAGDTVTIREAREQDLADLHDDSDESHFE